MSRFGKPTQPTSRRPSKAVERDAVTRHGEADRPGAGPSSPGITGLFGPSDLQAAIAATQTRTARSALSTATKQPQPRPSSASGRSHPHRVEPQPANKMSTRRSHPYLPPRSSSRSEPSRRPYYIATEGVSSEGNFIISDFTQASRLDLSDEANQPTNDHGATDFQVTPPSPIHAISSAPPPFSSTRIPSPACNPPLPPTPLPPNPLFARAEVTGTSYFPYSNNVNIGNLTTSYVSGSSRALFDCLAPYIAHGAAHNSAERCDAPTCHQETRVAIRQNIISWIKHGEGNEEPKQIMWLGGPAGCGKTTIAGSVAEACRKERLLAASFFFSSLSGSTDRSSKRCVVTTIASHLAEHGALHEYKAQLLRSIECNPAIFHKRLKDQAECLILEPLRSLQSCDTASWPKAIILDGLDEVEAQQSHNPVREETKRKHEADQLEILDVLFILVRDDAFPFRIFISSRPEKNIEEFFSSTAQGSTLSLFLDSRYNPDADIRLFLEAKLAEIRRRYGISDPVWPGRPAIDRIVDMSSGQFIVPVTIIRWIESGIPQRQLDDVLLLGRENIGSKNPFASLDALYCHILKRANDPDDDPHLVVKWIVSITYSKSFESVPPPALFWRYVFEDVEGEFSYRMGPVASLVSIPPPGDCSSPITFYHKSLTDYLSLKTRCGDLHINSVTRDRFIADRVLAVLKLAGIERRFPGANEFDFWNRFLHLQPLLSAPVMQRPLSSFIFSVSDIQKAGVELAFCNVAWWTELFLRSEYIGSGSLWFLLGLYCQIHKAMKCERNHLPLTEQGMQQLPHTSRCHAACVHWRTGILTKAKELNWCVHKLEETNPDELENVTAAQVVKEMKKVGPQLMDLTGYIPLCAICQPR